jgi:Bifunctional DNA primase/polymerase, N-terminal
LTALSLVESGGLLDATMSRLFSSGFTLIPLGGADGKKPLIAGWNGRRLPLDACMKRMRAVNCRTYGIRLDGLIVVDCDTDNDATRALVAERFAASNVTVRTGRGRHHYFRHDGLIPKAIREDGVAIDFKAGNSAFVVGPGSIRPVDCCAGQPGEVRLCESVNCALWPFRAGIHPDTSARMKKPLQEQDFPEGEAIDGSGPHD